jgi:hypothetical protein
MSNRAKLTELLLLTRPYSWIDTILNLLIGLAWIKGADAGARYLSAASIAMMLWFSLNWISEAIQRDPGRNPPRWHVAVAPLLIAGVWSVRLGDGQSLPWLIAYAALVFIYPWKTRNSLLGPLGPVLRGLQTGTLFMLGASFGAATPGVSRIFLSLALVQIARSLLADIRDVQTDLYELPRIIGSPASKWLSAVLLLAGTVAMPSVRPDNIEPQLILLLMLFLIVVLPSNYSYELHFAFILMFAFAKMALYTELLGESPHFNWMVLASAQVILSTTYWHVPRNSNRGFRERMDHAIRLIGGNHEPR